VSSRTRKGTVANRREVDARNRERRYRSLEAVDCPQLPRRNCSPEKNVSPRRSNIRRRAQALPRTRARDERSNNACPRLRMFVGFSNRRGSNALSGRAVSAGARWKLVAKRWMALRSIGGAAIRMVSGAMGVSAQPERRPRTERGLRDPREQRRQMAESEGCERQLTEDCGTVNATGKPHRRLVDATVSFRVRGFGEAAWALNS
jgi:hypothetical protein